MGGKGAEGREADCKWAPRARWVVPVHFVKDGDEEGLVELEGRRELLRDLPDAVDELDKDRAALVVGVIVAPVADSLLELVTKAEPLLGNQNLKALDGSVKRIQQHHRRGRELRCPVPAITAVYQYLCRRRRGKIR